MDEEEQIIIKVKVDTDVKKNLKVLWLAVCFCLIEECVVGT